MSDTEALLGRAKAALVSRDYSLAARLYKTLIAENPENIEFKIELGNLYVKSGKDDQALSVFRRIQSENSDNNSNIEILMAMSGIYRRQKKYDESVAVLEQALMIGTDSPKKHSEISYNLGFTYRLMGNYDDAINCFEDVVEENPKDVLTYNHLGAIYALQSKNEKAIESYQRGLKFDPNHPVLQFNIAKTYADMGDYTKALYYYEGALKARPGWQDAIEEYSNLLLKTDRVKEADEVVSQALKFNPDDVKIHTSMGNVYNRQSYFDNAEFEFKKALNGDGEYKPALTGLAHSQEKQGKHEEAAETIKKAAYLNPNDLAVLKQSAHILLSANYLSAAYKKISELWEKNKKDPQTVNLLGQYYICKGEKEKLDSCMKKIKMLSPDYNDVLKDWGHRFMQKGDHENAEQYLQSAVKTNPRDAEAMVYLGELFERQSRTDEASEMYRNASNADAFNQSAKMAESRLAERILNPEKTFDADSEEDLFEKNEIFSDSSVEDENQTEKDDLFEDLENLNESDSSDTPIDLDTLDIDDDKEKQDDNLIDDDFDFNQFGMEKALESDKEELVSVDDLMKMDEIDELNGSPTDIDELIDDGSPFDEEDSDDFMTIDQPKDSFLPEFTDEDIDGEETDDDFFAPKESPEIFLDENPAPEVAEPTVIKKIDISDETLEKLNDKIDELSFLADKANFAAEKALEAARKASENAELNMDKLVETVEETVENKLDEIIESESDVFEFPDEETSEEETEEIPEEEATEEESKEIIEEEVQEEETEEIPEEEASEEEVQEAESEESEEYVSEEEFFDHENSEEKTPEELMLQRAIEMLPNIVGAIEDRKILYRFRPYLELFITLRDMLEYLPEEQKEEFYASRTRILLDFVISRLSGRPGLFATSTALLHSGLLHENPQKKGSENEGVELASEVFNNLRNLAGSLKDEFLKDAMDKEVSALMEKL